MRLATAALAGLEQLTDLLREPVSRSPDPREKLAVANEILDRYERLQDEHRAPRERRMLSQIQRQGQKGLVDALDSLDGSWRTLIAFGQSFTYSDEGAE